VAYAVVKGVPHKNGALFAGGIVSGVYAHRGNMIRRPAVRAAALQSEFERFGALHVVTPRREWRDMELSTERYCRAISKQQQQKEAQ
jgi:hypothetical protein